MNKDVIYIEPEDDITDIITKIENSKEKIVALVPPKKAGVFRSVVNIKLISKVGKTSEKTIVLVTTDPSIVKLAASTQLPVTKDLKTAPVIPTMEEVAENVSETEVVEVDEEAEEPTEEEATSEDEAEAEATEEASEDTPDEGSDDVEPEETAEEKPEKKKKEPKAKGKKGAKNPIEWIKNHKKLSIICGIGIVILIAFLIWALFIAPAVDVAVTIKTESKNFSENVSFTETASDENVEEGKFYIEEKKVEAVQEVKFDATGQKNNGDRASGELSIMAAISHRGGTVVINAGDVFTYNGLSYTADNSVTLYYDGEDSSVCANEDDSQKDFRVNGCQIYSKVNVTASEPGSKYNGGASNSGWSTVSGVRVSSEAGMSGGTDDLVTVVQQSDIEAAKAKLNSSNEEENKAKLFESIDDNYFVIESSFSQSSDSVSATPGAGEEVKNGVQATLKATTEATVYVVDKTKLEEFINKKVELEEDQKIFEIKNMRFENVTKFAAGGTAKLKAQYYVGPKLTEGEIVDKIKGKGLGDAQREIRDIYGVTDVKINKSVPWVMRVPNDSNKVNVSIGFPEEQNKEEGEEGEQKDENKQDENKQNEEKTDN